MNRLSYLRNLGRKLFDLAEFALNAHSIESWACLSKTESARGLLDPPLLWRKCALPSGISATSVDSDSAMSREMLTPGLTALIRAKNEENNAYRCLSTIANLVDEVVFVDNNSEDRTFDEAVRAQQKYPNIRVFQYHQSVARIGSQHANAVANQPASTLARYYNWGLNKSRRTNFIKWDADFVAIQSNIKEMIDKLYLRSRTDPFTVWCGGVSIWTDGTRFWHDTKAAYNEFRVHSKRHGAIWVNLPDWEEIDQTYIFSAQKFCFTKPVFAEIRPIDFEFFNWRGTNLADRRDRERQRALEHFEKFGNLPPERFRQLDGIEQSHLTALRLSESSREAAFNSIANYSYVPRIRSRTSQRVVIEPLTRKQSTLGVFCFTDRPCQKRQQIIRQTLTKQFDRLRIPLYFVIEDTLGPERIDGDSLLVRYNPDGKSKGCNFAAVCAFILRELNVDYILKIPDDSAFLADRIVRLPFWRYDFLCGETSKRENYRKYWQNKVHGEATFNLNASKFVRAFPYNGELCAAFFSRKALSILIGVRAEIQRSNNADIAISDVLATADIVGQTEVARFRASDYAHWREEGERTDATLVANTPSADYNRVARKLTDAHRTADFSETYGVDSDWYDWQRYPTLNDMRQEKFNLNNDSL